MGVRPDKARQSHQEKKGIAPVCAAAGIPVYLQVVSILMGVIAVALPALIAGVGIVYIRRINERLDIISDEVDQLWDAQAEHEDPA